VSRASGESAFRLFGNGDHAVDADQRCGARKQKAVMSGGLNRSASAEAQA